MAAAPRTSGAAHVAAMLGEAYSNQETQYRVRLYNDGASAQVGMSARIFLNLSELSAAGLSASDLVNTLYWDSCGGAQVGAPVLWNSAQQIYYVPVGWPNNAIPAHGECEAQFSLHLSSWQNVWNANNDYSYQGLNAWSYTTTQNIPAYLNDTQLSGVTP